MKQIVPIITLLIFFGLAYPLAGQITLKKYDGPQKGGVETIIFETPVSPAGVPGTAGRTNKKEININARNKYLPRAQSFGKLTKDEGSYHKFTGGFPKDFFGNEHLMNEWSLRNYDLSQLDLIIRSGVYRDTTYIGKTAIVVYYEASAVSPYEVRNMKGYVEVFSRTGKLLGNIDLLKGANAVSMTDNARYIGVTYGGYDEDFSCFDEGFSVYEVKSGKEIFAHVPIIKGMINHPVKIGNLLMFTVSGSLSIEDNRPVKVYLFIDPTHHFIYRKVYMRNQLGGLTKITEEGMVFMESGKEVLHRFDQEFEIEQF